MDSQHTSAFAIFPEPVWESILDAVDHGRDIQNLFGLFPELDVTFHRKKTTWLFDQVFPHLVSKLNRYDMTSFARLCRQSCKRWCSGTDYFIRHHPSRRPYDQNGINRRTARYREFSSEDFDELHVQHWINLRTVEAIRKFGEALSRHSNPGNLLKTFQICIIRSWSSDYDQQERFVNATLDLFKSFGKHIWDIFLNFQSFHCEDVKSAEKILQKIIECLSCLPNVRSLVLIFDFHVHFSLSGIWNSSLWKRLPKQPHLETWRLIGNCPRYIKLNLIEHFKTQIRKLEIGGEYLMYCDRLKNLVEVKINFDRKSFNCEEIGSTIKCLPLLKKLKLDTSGPRIKMTASQFFGILANAQLEELDFLSCRILRDSDSSSLPTTLNREMFSSIKYLRLTDHKDQKLDFLTALPSLEQLHIHRLDGIMYKFYIKMLIWKEVDVLSSTVRFYLYEDIVPAAVSIWDKLPSLKLLRTVNHDDSVVKFARESGNKPFSACLKAPLENHNVGYDHMISGENSDDDSDENGMFDANSDEDRMSDANSDEARMSDANSDKDSMSDANIDEDMMSDANKNDYMGYSSDY